jgi:hypothetical protein
MVSVVQGGNAIGNVVKEPAGEDPFIKKHLGNVGYRDIVIEFGADMAPAMFDWIKAALQRQYGPKNGAIVTLDLNRRARSRLEFTGAQITEVTVPSGRRRQQGRRSIRRPADSARDDAEPESVSRGVRRAHGQDDGYSREPVLVHDQRDQRTPVRDEGGADYGQAPAAGRSVPGLRHLRARAGSADRLPTVSFTLAEAHAESVDQWLNDFVVNGNNDDAAERSGALSFMLNASARFTLSFSHLGIVEMAPEITDGTSNTILKVIVSMYCEQIAFDHFSSTP